MRRAARLGDGWMPYLVSPDAYARSVATVTAEAASAGRDLDGFEWMLYLYCSIRADGDQARDDVATFLGGAYGDKPPARCSTASPRPARPRRSPPGSRPTSTPGVRHIVISPATPEDTLEVVTLAAEEVLPAARTCRRSTRGPA